MPGLAWMDCVCVFFFRFFCSGDFRFVRFFSACLHYQPCRSFFSFLSFPIDCFQFIHSTGGTNRFIGRSLSLHSTRAPDPQPLSFFFPYIVIWGYFPLNGPALFLLFFFARPYVECVLLRIQYALCLPTLPLLYGYLPSSRCSK